MSADPPAEGAPGPGDRAVTLDLPEGWDQVPEPSPFALVARRTSHDGAVVPTVVVADTVDQQLSGFDDYLQVALAGAYATTGGYLVHLETLTRPAPGLELAIACEQLGSDVTVVQRHLLLGEGRAVVATGTAADVDWPAVAPEVLGAVRSLDLLR